MFLFKIYFKLLWLRTVMLSLAIYFIAVHKFFNVENMESEIPQSTSPQLPIYFSPRLSKWIFYHRFRVLDNVYPYRFPRIAALESSKSTWMSLFFTQSIAASHPVFVWFYTKIDQNELARQSLRAFSSLLLVHI